MKAPMQVKSRCLAFSNTPILQYFKIGQHFAGKSPVFEPCPEDQVFQVPIKMKLSDKELDRIVKRAICRIPRKIRQHLDNILISVQKRPSAEILKGMGVPADEPLLGLFTGVSQSERSVIEPPLFPDTIFLFQEPLKEVCHTTEELEEQIEITVVREIAHALGMSGVRLAELGYD